MGVFTDPLLILKDPQIRRYFLSILQSTLSEDEKYERFINFFELQGQVKSEMLGRYGDQLSSVEVNQFDKIASAAGQRIGIWEPDKILQQTRASITRALLRLKHSQHHRDGGWGFDPEVSGAWATAFAVLCLNAANQVSEFKLELEDQMNRGMTWLLEHQSVWDLEHIDKNQSKSVYDLSLVIRCCYEAGVTDFPYMGQARCKLSELQNKDGGWDARVYAADYAGLTKVFSDVGATRMAMQALATIKRYEQSHKSVDFNSILNNGMQWFLRNQNTDGSWNNGTCKPGILGVEGYPSITKTCDGIKGILCATDSLSELSDTEGATAKAAVNKAVDWLLSKEKALYDRTGTITGWGWGDDLIEDLRVDEMQNTWLTLETLVQADSPSLSLPLLTANAQWLMKQQHQPEANEDPIEDGKWEPVGHTARIALSLIEFYKKIKESPLFEKANEEESTAAFEEAAS
jgi:hypothetical protein